MNFAMMSRDREEFWSMMAHLTIGFNMFTGILGIPAALILYFAFRRRSVLVAFHALQSFFYQMVIWLGVWLVALALFILGNSLGGVGIFVMIIAFFVSLVPPLGLGFAMFAAYMVRRGNDEFTYPYVGEWARDVMSRS